MTPTRQSCHMRHQSRWPGYSGALRREIVSSSTILIIAAAADTAICDLAALKRDARRLYELLEEKEQGLITWWEALRTLCDACRNQCKKVGSEI
jgi:hypothetical protein